MGIRHFVRFVPLLLMLLSGCIIETSDGMDDTPVDGFVPVYGAPEQSTIALLSPRPIDQPGKIYRYGKYLLINEKRRGIHVYDNTNVSAPEPIGFIQLLGNTDMAIRNNILYADHVGQLVALEVTDFTTLTEKGRLPLTNWNLGVPAPRGFHFECIDQSKGMVIAWRRAQLSNPRCYAF